MSASGTALAIDIARSLRLFAGDGNVFEVRILGVKPDRGREYTVSGYFDDIDVAAKAVAEQDTHYQAGIYVTLNRCEPAILARSPNRLTKYPKHATSEGDITRRRWLFIDVDPKRPVGISSTNEQVESARTRAGEVREWLADYGWHEPVEAMSGNGWHLLYPIDLPNDECARSLCQNVLKAIACEFASDDDDAKMDIDQSVIDANRITKVYGTIARKGGETDDRPHRRTRLEHVPDYLANGHAEPMPLKRLEAVAATLPDKSERQDKSVAHVSNNGVSRSPYGAVDRCKSYIETIPDAVSGNKGHNPTLQAACECFRFGLSDPDAMVVMQWFNDTKTAGESFTEKELLHKLKDAREKVEAAGEFGKRNRGESIRQDSQGKPVVTAKPPVKFERITSAELDSNDYAMEYIVDGVLVAGQPMIVAGPQKSLKTNILIDLAVSLSSRGHFLGYFPVNRPAKVCIMSGESGMATIQETARRICVTAGRSLSELDVIWSPDLPRFDDADHHHALREFLVADEIEVLVIDPAYLTMPSENAGNMFSQGDLLRNMTDVCQSAGVQMILAHHTKKNRVTERFAPVELEDIAWSGFQEFARQWILVNRRKEYSPGTGEHHLWLSVGGSAGHSGRWAVDIDEGEFVASQPRKWDVKVSSVSAVKKAETDDKARQKAKQMEETENNNRRKLLDTLKLFPEGQTTTALKSTAGLNSTTFARAIQTLIKEGRVQKCQVTKSNKQSYDGWKPIEPGKVSHPDTRTTTP